MVGKNESHDPGVVGPVSEAFAPVFSRLAFLDDQEPREAALQLAVDRALLEAATLPILRIYRWMGACVTIGYFQQMAEAEAAHPSLSVVRRWTGGGTVEHGKDAPYSLIVPKCEAFAAVRPGESYRMLHGILASVLRGLLPGVTTAEEDAPRVSGACFANPVKDDLLVGDCKVAGAGQRRTRKGLLHQGSIQVGSPYFTQAKEFAARLSHSVEVIPLPAGVLERAREITVGTG